MTQVRDHTPQELRAQLAAAARGDGPAWDSLYGLYHRRVVRTLVARGIPIPEAQDVAQEAWAAVIERSRRKPLDELRLPALILRAARNKHIDRWRRTRYESPEAEGGQVEAARSEAVAPDRRVADRQRLARAIQALDTLGERRPRAKEVFLAVYAEGLPIPVAASRLGMSQQRVRQTLCEVRKVLRKEIEP